MTLRMNLLTSVTMIKAMAVGSSATLLYDMIASTLGMFDTGQLYEPP